MTGATIPAQELYWGLVAPMPGRRMSVPFRWERVLPLPVERLHHVATPLPDGRVVVVGIEPERFQAYLAGRSDLGSQHWTLVPDGLPTPLREEPAVPADLCQRLNLLVGPFEPAVRRTWRQRRTWIIHGACALILLFVVVGVERRARAAAHAAEALRIQTRRAVVAAVQAPPQDLHPELRLLAESRRLEQAAGAGRSTAPAVIPVVDQLWRSWPRDLRIQVLALTATGERIVIRGRAPGMAEADRLRAALAGAPPAGWRCEPLQVQQQDAQAAFVIALVPERAAAGGGR